MCHSARASWALPCCFLPHQFGFPRSQLEGRQHFHVSGQQIQYSFCIDLLCAWKKYRSYSCCVTKLASTVGALLYYALVIVTGSSIARCTGRKPTTLWKRPNARSCTLHCSVLILLSNRKMFFCNGIGSRRVPGDQELLKSGHWNSILWFITMNFIDLVYAEDLIRQSIWACALLGGTKCVLSLCFAPIQNEKCVQKSQLFCRMGIAFPSERQLQQRRVSVIQHQCIPWEET